MERAEAFVNMEDAHLVTDADLRTLRAEAGARGNTEMVATCDDALDGDQYALDVCADAMEDALDMLG